MKYRDSTMTVLCGLYKDIQGVLQSRDNTFKENKRFFFISSG
jgi:hypothetical protein